MKECEEQSVRKEVCEGSEGSEGVGETPRRYTQVTHSSMFYPSHLNNHT